MKIFACRLGLVAVLSLALAGCGAELDDRGSTVASRETTSGSGAPSLSAAPAAAAEAPTADASNTDTTDESSPAIKRRIIYDTQISLVVKDYRDFESTLPAIVERMGGFISRSETSRQYSDRQSGLWVVRIPVDRYAQFLRDVTGLGFAESRREDAQDVTEEFVDIEARIRNSQQLEERLITLLDERTGKLSDVLEIERELARVREEVERMQGRLRLLSDRTTLATVTIRCREELHYTPPTAPTLTSRIQSSWSGSLGALKTVGENLLVATVALLPWLVVLAIPLVLVLLVLRRLLRR